MKSYIGLYLYLFIAAFVLQHATFSHPTPIFPHDPLGIGGWPLATKSKRVGLIIRAVSFKDFQPRLYGPDQPTSQTDRQTVARTDRRRANAVLRFAL